MTATTARTGIFQVVARLTQAKARTSPGSNALLTHLLPALWAFSPLAIIAILVPVCGLVEEFDFELPETLVIGIG